MAKEQPPQEEKVIAYQVDEEKVQELVETFDPEMRFRNLKGLAAKVALIMCIILALFHIYTAGFGVLQEWKHRCFHLSFVLALIFLVFPTRKVKIKNLTWTWVYEVLFSFMAGSILAMGFQSIFKLVTAATGLIFAIGFFLGLRHEDSRPFALHNCPPAGSRGFGGRFGIVCLWIFAILQNWGDYVGESGTGFIIWTFCMLAVIGDPLLFMLHDSLRILSGKKRFVWIPRRFPILR